MTYFSSTNIIQTNTAITTSSNSKIVQKNEVISGKSENFDIFPKREHKEKIHFPERHVRFPERERHCGRKKFPPIEEHGPEHHKRHEPCRPERPEKPERCFKPERPEHPERPEKPHRPERPEPPTPPTPPEPPTPPPTPPEPEIQKVYMYGNSWYPLNTTKSSQGQADNSYGLIEQFGTNYSPATNFNGIFQKLDPEAKAAADNYGSMLGKNVVFGEDGSLVGVYNTADIEKLNGGHYGAYVNPDGTKTWGGIDTEKGKTITLPDGKKVEIIDNAFSSPLTFDLNGDGIKTSDKTTSYDINGDGKQETINDANDGVLCINGGKSGKDLFGDNTDLGDGKTYSNGFESLKALASKESLINGADDMKLDANDIKTLEDKYQFGMKTGGYNSEAQSLSKLGISEINLGNGKLETVDNFDSKGNKLMKESGATFKVNGEEKEYADVWNLIK